MDRGIWVLGHCADQRPGDDLAKRWAAFIAPACPAMPASAWRDRQRHDRRPRRAAGPKPAQPL